MLHIGVKRIFECVVSEWYFEKYCVRMWPCTMVTFNLYLVAFRKASFYQRYRFEWKCRVLWILKNSDKWNVNMELILAAYAPIKWHRFLCVCFCAVVVLYAGDIIRNKPMLFCQMAKTFC